MTTTDLAEWLRVEHERVQELRRALRTEIAIEPEENRELWVGRLRERFEHLRAHFTKRIALEEREGYLAGVLEQRPTLSSSVEKLEREHGQIARLMTAIRQTLQELGPEDHLVARDCCRRIGDLLDTIDQHEDRENLLLTYVYTQEIGTHG